MEARSGSLAARAAMQREEPIDSGSAGGGSAGCDPSAFPLAIARWVLRDRQQAAPRSLDAPYEPGFVIILAQKSVARRDRVDGSGMESQ